MAALEGETEGFQVGEGFALAGDGLAVEVPGDGGQGCPGSFNQGNGQPGGGRGDGFPGLGLLGAHDRGAAGFDDGGLFSGDGCQRGAQIGGVVQADSGDDGGDRGGNDVGGIQAAAHAHFDDGEIRRLFLEIKEGHGGFNLEARGLGMPVPDHGFRRQADLFSHGNQGGIGNGPAIQPDAFVEGFQGWGGVEAHPVTGAGQDGRGHGGGGALAVGAGDVDAPQVLLGIAQIMEEGADGFQPQLHAEEST